MQEMTTVKLEVYVCETIHYSAEIEVEIPASVLDSDDTPEVAIEEYIVWDNDTWNEVIEKTRFEDGYVTDEELHFEVENVLED